MPAFFWDGSAYVKQCCTCGTIYRGTSTQKESEEIFAEYFYFSRTRGCDGFCYRCKSCYQIRDRRAWKYGLTFSDLERMLASQDFRCAICQTEISLVRHPAAAFCNLSVDHDHSTGRVRQLLCNRCNTGMYWVDNLTWREAAIAYHDFHRAKEAE